MKIQYESALKASIGVKEVELNHKNETVNYDTS